MEAARKSLEKNADKIVAILIILVMISGAAYSILLGNSLRYWDENEYFSVSKNLQHGIFSLNGETPTAFSAPGYPIILYLLSWINPQIVFLRFFNFIFLGLSIALVYSLMKKVSSIYSGLIAAIVIAVYPLNFYTAGTLYSQTADGFFLIATLYIISIERTNRQLLMGFIAGLFFGALILITPSFLLLLPVFCLYPWIVKKEKRLMTMLIFIVATAVPIAPWSIRNYVVFDHLILVSTNSGINLLLGNSENTRPNSGVNVDLTKYMKNEPPNLDDYEEDKYYRNQALKWIKEHPGEASWLYVEKVINYFNFRNELATKKEISQFRDDIVFVTYYPLLFLFFLRLIFFKKFPINRMELFLIIIYLTSPFLLAIFFTRIRFRIPFDYLMIMVAASFLGHWIGQKERT